MLESRVVFEKNLRALAKRAPNLVSALTAATTESVECETGPRGASVLKQNGVLLGSAYDPVREGAQIASSMASEPADILVALGFGLGEQFAPYLELNSAILIIYEPSIERLRAALERISIANLIATHKDVYITCDLDVFAATFSARYVPGLRTRVFPHPALLRLDPTAVAKAVEVTSRKKASVDSHIMTSVDSLMPWAWMTALNGERIAQTPNLGKLEGKFQGLPAVVVAAGPSLDKQLPILREVQDRVVIIAIGQTVKALRAAGIEPHLVHVLESQDVSHQLTDAGDTRDLCTAYTPDCHPAIFDVPTRARFCAIARASPMGSWIANATEKEPTGFTMGGGTVAQGAVGIASVLGCNPIALIGQDLAFTEGRVYASGSAYDFVSVQVDDEGICRFTNMKRKVGLLKKDNIEKQDDLSRATSAVWVDGWNEGEKVQTWPAYAVFIDQYRDMGYDLARRNIALVNCTEGGARIHGLEHRAFREFLSEAAGDPHDAHRVLREVYDAFTPYALPDYADAIRRSRRELARIEEANLKGLRFVNKATERLRSAQNDQQRVEVLRGIARHEKRVRHQLERVPWLDSLVQPEIYRALAGFRRADRQDPSGDDLVEESTFLFRAAKNGIGRARQWFDAFEESFEASSDTREDVVRARPEFLYPSSPAT